MSTNHLWRPLNNPDFGMVNTISSVIAQQEWLNPDLLTSIRNAQTLIMASDYGASRKITQYESISFIIADLAGCSHWHLLRSNVRKRTLGFRRTMSFKKLMSDKVRARSLIPFLRAADTIPGLLATFLIDKRIIQFLSEPMPDDDTKSPVGKLGHWKEGVFERLTRIGQLGAMLIAGMSSTGQDLLWFSDRD